jgi:2-alkyl-3-oxoalkanoate reductase
VTACTSAGWRTDCGAGKGVIVGRGDNALPFVYVTDVVQGLLLALDCDHAVGQAYNISNDCPLTQRQLLDTITRDTGRKSRSAKACV